LKKLKAYSLALALLFLVGGGMSHAQPGAGFAEGPGADLVKKKCTLCHDPANIISLRQTREEWEETVRVMIRRGAPVSAAELGPIVDYLTKYYGKQK